MKRYTRQILIVFFAGLAGCQIEIEPGTPGCIQTIIKDFSKSEPCAIGKTVNKYSFQGEIVYVFEPGLCGNDLATDVYDSDCNFLGFLGGIAGISEINGEEFSKAIFKGVIWNN